MSGSTGLSRNQRQAMREFTASKTSMTCPHPLAALSRRLYRVLTGAEERHHTGRSRRPGITFAIIRPYMDWQMRTSDRQPHGGQQAGAVSDGRQRRARIAPAALKSALAEAAHAQGFDVIGVTRPDSIPLALERLRQFLAEGGHGDMDWLETTAPRRGDPRALWPDVRSVIMLGMNYGPDADPLAILQERAHGAISVYAQGVDYHDIIKPRLKAVARWLTAEAQGDVPVDVKVFVDTAAVMEKPLAVQAGLGWQGKHTNVVSRQFGSWLFLGAIFTTLDLPPDEAEPDHCGRCRACLDVCPTAAFPAPYRLDARRCISYLTIEHKGPIPRELRASMGNRIYGCDDCLAVCPWNKYAQLGRETKLSARADL